MDLSQTQFGVCVYLGRVLYSLGGVPLVVYIFFGVGCSIENG